MKTPGGRRNAELEAWDRELRKSTGADEAGGPGEERPEAPEGPADPAISASSPEGVQGPGRSEDMAGASPEGSGAAPGIATGGAAGTASGASAKAAAAPAGGSIPPGSPHGGDGAPPATWSSPDDGVTTEVLLRDLIIFQVKLLLDGLKDIVLSPLSIAAVLWDMVPSRNSPRGRAFYQVLKVGERFDLWLNLYNPSHAVRKDHEGLLEAGAHSADSLMGKLEQLARAEAEKKGAWQGVGSVSPLGGKAKKGNDLDGE